MVQEYVNLTLEGIIASAKSPTELAGIRVLFGQFISGEISGFEFPSVVGTYLRENYSAEDAKVVDEKLTELMIDADRRLRQSQTRFDITDLITPQEQALLQSGESGTEGISKDLHTDPYKPMILRKKPSTDIAAVNAQRAKHPTYGAWGLYFGLGERIIQVTLEPLSEKGETIRDPRPLDGALQPVTSYVKSPNFPFARQG